MILCSSSVTRAELLKKAGVEFIQKNVILMKTVLKLMTLTNLL